MERAGLADLDAFAAVARLGSFRKAAKERGVSPSALSHCVRRLEDRLGVRLLNRTTRSLAPTEAGERLLDRLGPALSSIEGALSEIDGFRDRPFGRLRLSVPRSAAAFALAPLVARFTRLYPEVDLEVEADDGLVDVVAAGFDAGVRIGENIALDMISLPLGPPLRLVIVGAPSLLAGAPPLTDPADLRRFPTIAFRFPEGVYRWELEKAGRRVTVDPTGPLCVNDHTLLEAASAGAGLACVLRPRAADWLADGRLRPVLEDWCPAFPGLRLYYPSRRMTAALRAFIETLRLGATHSPPNTGAPWDGGDEE
ncbi:LysR family transcriptional regulator [Rhodospirillum rubrum]|uniref:LysR family transcriptional regulator n=1 Tax=Rhodospirillum rubrum TaxID=1085 RepID=UPI0028A988A5|nr:LysR family transcriptional regulator [Rhodospirillum rubrum]